MRKARLAASLFAFTLAAAANASVIDFETTPSGGTPVDNAFLTAPYNVAEGGTVRFFFDVNNNNAYDVGVDGVPVFEQVGNDYVNGFYNYQLDQYDVASPGYESLLGSFFIRNETFPLYPLIVAYDTPNEISRLFGEIWDVDADPTGFEQWRVDVLNSSSSVLATLDSPAGTDGLNPLDGRAWTFDFSSLPIGADALRITFIGSKEGGVGLAFNNFGVEFSGITPVPEAGSIGLLAAVGGLFAVVARRRKR